VNLIVVFGRFVRYNGRLVQNNRVRIFLSFSLTFWQNNREGKKRGFYAVKGQENGVFLPYLPYFRFFPVLSGFFRFFQFVKFGTFTFSHFFGGA